MRFGLDLRFDLTGPLASFKINQSQSCIPRNAHSFSQPLLFSIGVHDVSLGPKEPRTFSQGRLEMPYRKP